ncbi:sigma-70 family RNA polymerase sigma factor [Ruicaihuangia caeni]|uniref:sigma-70 family RNA polymerase sigma factor n=1 Tax=Ruicaihuangia caeni TaxID=3042517 RepID=UPI003390704E
MSRTTALRERTTVISSEQTSASRVPSRASRPSATPADASVDVVHDYLSKIGTYPLLTAQEETELAQIIEVGLFARERLETKGDSLTPKEKRELRQLIHEGEAAHKRFIQSNLRLVVSVAKRYTNTGVPLIDLIQEGNIGLDRAVKKFDFAQGYKFSTYATWWIKHAVNRCVYDSARLIRVPVHTEEKITAVRRAAALFEIETGRTPTAEELADETGFSAENIERYIEADRTPVSIHIPVGDEADSELGDLIMDDDTAPVVDIVHAGIRREKLQEKLKTLPQRDADVLRMHFGLDNREPMTLEQLGGVLGISRERVRQIEQRALAKLRCPELADMLEDEPPLIDEKEAK